VGTVHIKATTSFWSCRGYQSR